MGEARPTPLGPRTLRCAQPSGVTMRVGTQVKAGPVEIRELQIRVEVNP